MKLNIELNELYYTDSQVFIKILRLLRNSYSKEISKFLIYADDNYLNYLKKISLDKQNVYIYYLKNTDNDDFIGFTLFKKINSSLFLNQFIIENAYQNKGLGKYLLINSIKMIESTIGKGAFKNLELEAFSSNILVNQWYRKMGLEVCGIRSWYLASKNTNSTSIAPAKTEKYESFVDENNFTQLLNSNGKHIGTVINNKYLRLNCDDVGVSELLRLPFEDVCITSRMDISLPLIDRSVLYRSPIFRILK
ncbi:MAG: hypothetical protein JWQ66_3389 [Mucilaginibacter sp.]|nr:hypothetical protein [Mucilaginibacter sp.]